MALRIPRPCLTCGIPSREGSYCADHKPVKVDSPQRQAKKRQQYNAHYRKLAKQVRDNAVECWICGQGPRPDDPWQADHLEPGGLAMGLAPAHRSCNAKRGDKPVEQVLRERRGTHSQGR